MYPISLTFFPSAISWSTSRSRPLRGSAGASPPRYASNTALDTDGLRRPGFPYQSELEILTVKALLSLIYGPEAYSRDSVEILWRVRSEKVLRPDIGNCLASEEPGQGRRSLPAQRTLDAVRSLPYSVLSRRSTSPTLRERWRRMPEFDHAARYVDVGRYSGFAIAPISLAPGAENRTIPRSGTRLAVVH